MRNTNKSRVRSKSEGQSHSRRYQPTEGLAGPRQAASNLPRGRAERGGRTRTCIQVVPDVGPWWCGARQAASNPPRAWQPEARSQLDATWHGAGPRCCCAFQAASNTRRAWQALHPTSHGAGPSMAVAPVAASKSCLAALLGPAPCQVGCGACQALGGLDAAWRAPHHCCSWSGTTWMQLSTRVTNFQAWPTVRRILDTTDSRLGRLCRACTAH